MSTQGEWVLRNTELLRTSPDPMWVRLRELLEDYLDKPVEQGLLTEWVDLTERHASSPYGNDMAAALDLLTKPGGRD